MITVKVGARSYELDAEGNPKIGSSSKYQEGDSRRLGPQYVHYQYDTRKREARRARMNEHARTAEFGRPAYRSYRAMRQAAAGKVVFS